MVRRLFLGMTLFFMCVVMFQMSSCKKHQPGADIVITLSAQEVSVVEGKTVELSAEVAGLEDYALQWESSDASVVVVESTDGSKAVLSGVAPGKADVVVSFAAGAGLPDNAGNVRAVCKVTVEEKVHVPSELPYIDYDATNMDPEVIEYETGMGRAQIELQLPFEDPSAPPYYAFFNKDMNVGIAVYDISSLVYDARLIYAFCKEEYDKAENLYSMLEDSGYELYGNFDGTVFYSKPGETVKISPIVFEQEPYTEFCTMVEFINKDASLLQPKKVHPVIPSVIDLPEFEMLSKSREEIIAFEDGLGLRSLTENPDVAEPNMLFVADDFENTNLENVIYYLNYNGEKFLEARLLCVDCMDDIKSEEFIEWMNNCGYPVKAWDEINLFGENMLFTTYGGEFEDEYVISITHKTRDNTADKSYFRMQIMENVQP